MLGHPRPVTRVLLLLSAFAAVASARAQERCVVDPSSGLSIPTRGGGVCLGTVEGETLLAQRNRQGLFVVALGQAPVAERGVEVHQPSPRVLYCPASLLDFGHGTPGAGCLLPGAGLRPGPGALVGAGHVSASLPIDAAGASSRVVASLVSAEGDRFEVTGSLRTFPSLQTGAGSGAYDRVEIEYRGDPGSSEAPAPALSPEKERRLGRLMELDDEQWEAIELMLALTPGDWALLQSIVTEASTTAKPTGAAPPSAGAIDLGASATETSTAETKVQSLTTILNGIVTRISGVRTAVDGLIARVPDRPDIRSLVGQIDLAQLRGVIDPVRDTLQGLVDIVRELRSGFETFDVTRFRQRLGGVLDDMERVAMLSQRLLCLDDPEFTPRPFPTGLLRRLLDRVPPVVLYATSRVLDAIRTDWDVALGEIVDGVPPELSEFCSDGVPTRALSAEVETAICRTLRPKFVKQALGQSQVSVAAALLVFRFMKNRTSEQIAVTAGANVVAGATVGTVIKNPAYEFAEGVVEKTERVKDLLEKLVDLRKDCLDTDADVENDLRDCAKDGCACTVPLSMVLGGEVHPSYVYAARLVEARITQAAGAGVGDIEAAQSFFATAEDDANVGTAIGYSALCQAYRAILVPTVVAAPAPAAAPEVRRERGAGRRPSRAN